jgi:hypothetical protein
MVRVDSPLKRVEALARSSGASKSKSRLVEDMLLRFVTERIWLMVLSGWGSLGRKLVMVSFLSTARFGGSMDLLDWSCSGLSLLEYICLIWLRYSASISLSLSFLWFLRLS